MRVIVDDAVIASASTAGNGLDLHELLLHACRGRHVIIGDFDEWLKTLDPGTSRIYRIGLQNSLRRSLALPAEVSTIQIKENVNSVWDDPLSVLNLSDALMVLREKLGILVENATNDWNFLVKLADQVSRATLEFALQKGWIEVLHGGGADMVERMRSRARTPALLLRTFALFDSDRHHQDELVPGWEPPEDATCQGLITEKQAKALIEKRYWRLQRRFIESYLPKEELLSHEEVSQNVAKGATEAYFRMPEHARWFFDMKKGFSSDSKNKAQIRQKTLYSLVSPDDRRLLNGGFGRAAQRYTLSDAVFIWDEAAIAEASAQFPNLMRTI